MKGLLLNLIAIFLLPGGAHAATNWSWDAQTRIRNEVHTNPAGTTGGSLTTFDHQFTEQRTLLGLNFNQGESFKGRLGLVHAFNWGDDGAANGTKEFNGAAGASGTAGGGIGSPRGVADQQNLLLVNEAWLWWAFGDSLAIEGGRSAIEIADGKVISKNEDEVTPTSFDGVKIHYDHDILLFRAFAVRAFDGFNPNTAATQGTFANDPEVNFFGGAVDFKGLPEWLRHFSFHYFKVNSAGSAITPLGDSTSDRLGFMIGGSARWLSYKASVAAHSGESTTAGVVTETSGFMADGGVKVSLPELWNFFLSVGYHFDSGDSDGGTTDGKQGTYDAFFYDTHSNAGLMDIIEWGNLTYIYGSLGVTVYDIETLISVHAFKQTQAVTPTNLGTHGTFLAAGAGAATTIDLDTSDDIGLEIDASSSYKFDNGLKAALRVGFFLPGAEFGTGNDETYSQIVLEGTMVF